VYVLKHVYDHNESLYNLNNKVTCFVIPVGQIPVIAGCLILPAKTEHMVLLKLDLPDPTGPVSSNRKSVTASGLGGVMVATSSCSLPRNCNVGHGHHVKRVNNIIKIFYSGKPSAEFVVMLKYFAQLNIPCQFYYKQIIRFHNVPTVSSIVGYFLQGVAVVSLLGRWPSTNKRV